MKRINILILIWISSFSGTCQNKIDLCDKKTALANLEEVRKNARALIYVKGINSGLQEDCVREFLDTLISGFVKNHNKEYIATLDAICRAADGSLAEYFVDIAEKLIFESFDSFIEYLSLQKENSCFEKNLIEIMKWKLQDGTNPGKDKLIRLIDEKRKSEKNMKTKSYLVELMKKIEQ